MGERERVQLLLWRAGMGATPAQVDAATAKGYAAAVDDMLNYPDAPASAPDLPPWPAQPKRQLTGDEKTQQAKAINQANQQGIKMAASWWAGLMRTSAIAVAGEPDPLLAQPLRHRERQGAPPRLHAPAEPTLPRDGRGQVR